MLPTSCCWQQQEKVLHLCESFAMTKDILFKNQKQDNKKHIFFKRRERVNVDSLYFKDALINCAHECNLLGIIIIIIFI